MTDYAAEIAALPRIKFVCERNWFYDRGTYDIGFLWSKNDAPAEGELVYRKTFILRFRLGLQVIR